MKGITEEEIDSFIREVIQKANAPKKSKVPIDQCPQCGGKLTASEGCWICHNCGYGRCG